MQYRKSLQSLAVALAFCLAALLGSLSKGPRRRGVDDQREIATDGAESGVSFHGQCRDQGGSRDSNGHRR